ncbi:MAG TPA: hypothetical protein VMS76_10795, partial [Planctomycetota bacterium]|nr:hypothetical protein [Planctomycetota bacterium]
MGDLFILFAVLAVLGLALAGPLLALAALLRTGPRGSLSRRIAALERELARFRRAETEGVQKGPPAREAPRAAPPMVSPPSVSPAPGPPEPAPKEPPLPRREAAADDR